MPRYVALLRAINVGGRNRLAMAKLRAMLDELEFSGGQTLLQSGNVVFQSDRTRPAALEAMFERETSKRLNLEVDYLVRSSSELNRAIARNPFPSEAKSDPARTALMFLKSPPSASQVESLRSAILGRERLAADGNHLYVVYPDGIGTSKLNGNVIERHLATRGTMRNWNTLLKLAALAEG